jgi:glutamate racemase
VGPIGVFDSGMGGLTVLRALLRRLPDEDFIYFGDTARVPYGTKGARTVRAFARQDAAFLHAQGVKMIVVACNTASAFALDELQQEFPVPVLGVIEPGIEAALARTRGGPIGVIGTSGTIRSGKYQEGLARVVGAARVRARECPLFVPLAEEGLTEHPITEMAVAEYLLPLREAGVDTLILGCTHYPLLKPAISRFMEPETTLVDSAEALAEAAARTLVERGLVRPIVAPPVAAGADAPARPQLEFWLSDVPWKFAEAGARFLGRPIEAVRQVNLDEVEQAARLVREQRSGA